MATIGFIGLGNMGGADGGQSGTAMGTWCRDSICRRRRWRPRKNPACVQRKM